MAAPHLSLSLRSGLDSGLYIWPGGGGGRCLNASWIPYLRWKDIVCLFRPHSDKEREGSPCSPSRAERFHEATLCPPSCKLYSPMPWLPFSTDGWAHDLFSAPTRVILLSPPILLLFHMIFKWLICVLCVCGGVGSWGLVANICPAYFLVFFYIWSATFEVAKSPKMYTFTLGSALTACLWAMDRAQNNQKDGKIWSSNTPQCPLHPMQHNRMTQ